MVIWLLLMVVPWALIIWLAVALLRAGRRRGPGVAVPAGLSGVLGMLRRGANRRVWLAASAGAAAGSVVLLLALSGEWGVQAVALAALAAAGAACVAVALVGPPIGAAPAVRTAELAPRSWRGFGPPWAFPIPAALTVLLVGLLVGAAVVASTPPAGAGPALAWTSTDGLTGYVTPWPGWSTVLPLLGALGVAAGCYLLGLHRVAGWPRPTEPALFGVDDEVRRTGTRMLLFSASGALLTALGTISYVCLRAWDTAAMTIRINRDTDLPVLDTPTEVGYATAESTLEQALDLASIAAAVTTLAGLTFMLAALAAGWVRTPQQAEQPVAPR
jgi:hypothetical protein